MEGVYNNHANREQEKKTGHKFTLEDRKTGILMGISDVISFDTDEIVLESQCGGIIIKGNELHVKNINLEKGEVTIEGNVDSLIYTKTKMKNNESLIKKLFK